MRIIAGQFKGRRLAGPEGPRLRPTSDSLRETLFNILGPSLEGANVLDAFAGTGAVGLEALSRGATGVTFIERDRQAITLLEGNIRLCGAGKACAIVKDDFFDVAVTDMFDLVFLDPPYDVVDLHAVVSTAAPLVAHGGRLVLEHSRRRVSPEAAATLRRTRLVTAGDSALSFYQ
jgi:16S rRNA (guanine966-N2)-methyltransferase